MPEWPDLSFIAKGILYICLTVITIVFVNSCQVDAEVILNAKPLAAQMAIEWIRYLFLDVIVPQKIVTIPNYGFYQENK